MMPYYVFALADRVPAGRQGRGIAGALTARPVPGGFAIVERRADVPPIELGALQAHDAVVARLARALPAILPVRFGTLMELDEIEAALDEREEEMTEAFDLVRDRVQFTWRAISDPKSQARGPTLERGSIAGVRTQGSGTAYLRRIAREAKPKPPALFRPACDTMRTLVSLERYQPPTPSLPSSLYHLVNRTDLSRYLERARTIPSSTVRLTGPFPPFAFTPELL